MGRPKAGYRTKNGKRVPGVTTVIGRFADKGGLMWWAFDQGKAAERGEIESLYDKRDEAAASGTLAHDMIELHLAGKDQMEAVTDQSKEIIEKACKGFAAFELWAAQSRMEVIETEIPLVSEKYRFGGMPDAMIMMNGKLLIGDWKTGNKVYPDALIQVGGGYKILWEENHPSEKIEGFEIMRFSKEEADFAHFHFDQLDDAQEQFLLFLKAYELDKKIKKRI